MIIVINDYLQRYICTTHAQKNMIAQAQRACIKRFPPSWSASFCMWKCAEQDACKLYTDITLICEVTGVLVVIPKGTCAE